MPNNYELILVFAFLLFLGLGKFPFRDGWILPEDGTTGCMQSLIFTELIIGIGHFVTAFWTETTQILNLSNYVPLK